MGKMIIHTSSMRYRGQPRAIDITVKSGIYAFAPTWDMVLGFKNGKYTWEQYEKMYTDMMIKSQITHKHLWDEMIQSPCVVLVCYCTDYRFCHRRLLAEMLVIYAKANGVDAEYMGEWPS